MIELVKVIADYGVTLVIAAVCIWGVVKTVLAIVNAIPKFFNSFIDQMREMNKHYAAQNKNIAVSLGTINTTLTIIEKQGEENYVFFKEHDNRAEDIKNTLTRIDTKIDKCPK